MLARPVARHWISPPRPKPPRNRNGNRLRLSAGAIAGLLALTAYLTDYIGRPWQPADSVAWLSPFRYYTPFEVPARHLPLRPPVSVAPSVHAFPQHPHRILNSPALPLGMRETNKDSSLRKALSRDLARTLQALYESEIQVTIAALQNSRFEFCVGLSGDHGNVESASKLADALHESALKAFPESRYALGDGEFQRKRGIRLL